MQATPGTEKDTMYLLNFSESNNFHHAIHSKDIFKTYTSHLEFYKERKPITERRVKVGKTIKVMRRAKRRKVAKEPIVKGGLDNLPNTLFNRAMDYIVMGVINNEFSFILPDKGGLIRLERYKEPKSVFKYNNIDALKVNFQYYKVVLKLKGTSKYRFEKTCYFGLSPKFKDRLHERLYDQTAKFSTIKTLNTSQLATILQTIYYPKLDIKVIRSILRRGFQYVVNGSYYKADFVFYIKGENLDDWRLEFIYICNLNYDYEQKVKFLRKIRFLEIIRNEKYSGYYYAALTHEEFNTFNNGYTPVTLFKIMEECMLQAQYRPHIIKVKVRKPLIKKYKIYREIKYAKSNTEYVWRWNGKRFESVDNSEYRFNRRIKWDIDHI